MSNSSTHEICKIVGVRRGVAILFLLLYFSTHKNKSTNNSLFKAKDYDNWSLKINNSFKASKIVPSSLNY